MNTSLIWAVMHRVPLVDGPKLFSKYYDIDEDICTNLNYLENMDGSEVMHRLWNRDLAAVLNFRHILNNLRYDGIIPVRFTRVIRIGRIRRQAEEDLQEGRRLRQKLTRIQR
ncbi:hypothetical protein PHYBLDRAFT_169691 [Phycomyces blakesleeanus NRRL 1555(-)]|uniref:Uncharacterized protein n=1 Tax=Phycomyces blakesleeanus (strain ATCC 8743b / DSM 1359 / FGSC 10004 / NBRC 33097 / NRRL 1555) TaxID=763407 RepID=A0A162U5V6_PHYB8|nr:hypothetical protein PHYBLDRAFT_169691 [Phycomyces blakesleeanus NRRL 1555(-)]OAD72563.1 hypothetical protein PHYBLDRAFT_169691 [Phycomyces blakesleeanus NRRL 1555(-)]|eukprot:XP_018290603.1 hypothetical protein PHYBLDRAFT_169691 [Phycomyces blakesleeanus NRRL 1555(-)]